MISIMEILMAQLLVRNLDGDVKLKLQRRARRNGRSAEEEVRAILRSAVLEEGPPPPPLRTRLRQRVAEIGLDEDILELRKQQAELAEFGASFCSTSMFFQR
jgi:plasmid stability protein